MKNIYRLFLLLIFFVGITGCKKDEPQKEDKTNNANLPSVLTRDVTNIFISTATCGGNVTDDGGDTVSSRGVCYGKNHNPTIDDYKTFNGMRTGVFSSYLSYLMPNTTYYIRAYATNQKGTAYGDEKQFTTQDVAGIVTDVDGNTYPSIIIDTKVWMAEDLRVTHYPNGEPIPNVTDNVAWANLRQNNTDDAYCFYNNDSNTVYGALYSYAAAIGDNWQKDNSSIDGEGGQGVCPDGWHLPTDAEWSLLRYRLVNNGTGGQSAGGKMKEMGTTHWNSPNTGATNSSRFMALPGGDRLPNGPFVGQKDVAVWWSAKDYATTMAYYWKISYNSTLLNHQFSDKTNGFSVRCVRD